MIDLALMRSVALKLTGQPVTVRFEDPKTNLASSGATYKGLDGRAVVHIARYYESPSDELFRIFTHELAHVKLHLPIMWPVDVDKAGAVFFSPSKHVDARVMGREQEAEAQADKWRKFAKCNCWMYQIRSENSRFDSMLKALLIDYKEQ